MPTLQPVRTRYETGGSIRKVSVKQVIGDMQLRFQRSLVREAQNSRNDGISVPSMDEIREKIFPDILAIEYINYAQEIVARRGEITTYSATLTQTDFSQNAFGGWSTTYPVAAYQIDKVLYRTGSDEGKALENGVISIDDLERRTPDWRNAETSTPPRYGVLWGKDKFGLYPKPSDSTYSVDLIGIGKPAVVSYDTGNGVVASVAGGQTLTDSTKSWVTDMWLNGYVELFRNDRPGIDEAVYTGNTSTVITFNGGGGTGTFDYRVDNVLSIPDEYHAITIDLATSIILFGSVSLAEEKVLSSRSWRELWRSNQIAGHVDQESLRYFRR